METVLEIENLQKSYGDVRALQGISFQVERGSLFSFLGINGAGKSTTINILCSIIKKDFGKVSIFGQDLDTQADKIKSKIGIVFQNSVLDDLLTVKDNLAVRAAFYGLKGAKWRARLEELTETLSLQELLHRPFGRLSGGQKRRADIARGLINRPQLLILDEPTTGLDPQTRKMVWNTIEDLRQKTGMTVFLTTHYMEEADGSDQVVILDGGKIAAQGTPTELKNEYSDSGLFVYGDAAALSAYFAKEGIAAEACGDRCRISMRNGAQVLKFLKKYPEQTQDFEYIKGNMDDVFVRVTGKKLEGRDE